MLKVNNRFNKIDLNNLKDPIKRAKVLVLGTLISVNLYSGVTIEKAYSETKDSYSTEESIFDIPECYKTQIEKECDITFDDSDYSSIYNIKSLSLNIKSEESLEFLKEFTNLKKLSLCFETPNDYVLDTVPEISSLESLTIKAREDLEISEKINNLVFENNKNNIENLCLSGIIIGPNVIESLPNLKNLKLEVSLSNDLDYSKLKINTLDISYYGAYDIPIFLSRKDYIDLIDNEVNIQFGENELEYLEVLDKLDCIIESLELENKSDKEKVNSVICYILDNLQYDEDVQIAIENGEDLSPLIVGKGFYHDGNLKAALDYETQICGNYTALCKALLKELNIKSFYTLSETHSWNLIEIENTPYYVDTTYLDVNEENASNKIEKNDVSNLDWYMKKPGDVSIIDDGRDHNPVLYPKYFENNIEEVKDNIDYKEKNTTEEKSSNTNKKVNIIVNNKNYRVPLGALVGILTALGLAKPGRRKRKKIKRIESKNNKTNSFTIDDSETKAINFNNDCNYYDYIFKNRRGRK